MSKIQEDVKKGENGYLPFEKFIQGKIGRHATIVTGQIKYKTCLKVPHCFIRRLIEPILRICFEKNPSVSQFFCPYYRTENIAV